MDLADLVSRPSYREPDVNDECAIVPPAVLDAFGLPGDGEALPGGSGRSRRHGAGVLKPVDDPAETELAAELLADLRPTDFRVARPLRARDGRWVVDGWSATAYVEGDTGPAGRWDQLLRAARGFHAALSAATRPPFLRDRTHRWAHADRVAWGEAAADPGPEVAAHLARLRRILRPVRLPSQLVHGDLAGNVLFADGQPPAIIDFSAYWRPAAYADAIVAVDGLLWYGAEAGLVSSAASGADVPQLLIRALIFRLVAFDTHAREHGRADPDELARFDRVVELVEYLARRNDG